MQLSAHLKLEVLDSPAVKNDRYPVCKHYLLQEAKRNMRNLGIALLAFAAATLQSCAVIDDDRTARCGGSHRLEVVDLDMSPDPIGEGQRINRWLVRLRADGSGECRTVVRIREAGGDEIGRERAYRLRPGMNAIEVEPHERYRFGRNEHCFQVVADIAGTARPVDAARRFCARQIAGRRWSMR
jgi:hypothetical protein